MRLVFPDAKNQTSGANPSEAYTCDLSIFITSLREIIKDHLRDQSLV